MNNSLARYINRGGLSKFEMLMSRAYPSLGMKNCRPVQNDYQQFTEVSSTTQQLTLPAYDGTNSAVLETKRFFNQYLANDIYAAIVHGSLATDDEINYSDFDALIVIKDEVFGEASRLNTVCKKLSQAQRFLRLQDPLQHHGWMVLSQKALLQYDKNYLPIETLQLGKSLVGDEEVVLEWQPGPSSDIRESVRAICQSINDKLRHPKMKQSAYFLKGTLSELMLLPALWFQATQGEGIYKGDSFVRAKPAFSDKEWSAIEVASTIRSQWPKYNNSLVSRLNNFNPVLASWAAKRSQWPISDAVLALLNDEFLMSAELFIERCKSEVV